MNSLKTIMLVMSPSRRASAALHRAAAYAGRTDAVLHLCLFDHYRPIDYSKAIFGAEVADRARRDFLEERMHWLAEQAGALVDQGLRVEWDAIWAPNPYQSVIAKMQGIRADLVIKDVDSAPRGAAGLHPSGLDWKLLRLSPMPLMLVQPASKPLPRRLLAAVDVSVAGETGQLNDRVLESARFCAALSRADVLAASVFCCVPHEMYGSGFIANTYDIMDAAHQDSLLKFAARHHVEPGKVLRRIALDAAQELAGFAQERQIDLMVLGSAYHRGLDRLMFGTTAESLMRKLACDVLLIKPQGFEGALSGQPQL